jgi:hypothetical protein
MEKEEDVVLESKLNHNLSDKEEEYVESFIRKGRLSFEISKIISELEKIDSNTTLKDTTKINKIIEILFLGNLKEDLPSYVSKATSGVYICRRTIQGMRVVVAQSTSLRKVLEAHREFCIKYNLK